MRTNIRRGTRNVRSFEFSKVSFAILNNVLMLNTSISNRGDDDNERIINWNETSI